MSHLESIIAAIEEIAPPPAGVVLSGTTSFEADLGFDSGGFIELFLALEDSIEGFTLGSSRLAPEDFETLGSLARFIARRMTEQDREEAA